jgi:hypothetical protein
VDEESPEYFACYDREHPGNSASHHTGKPCIEPDCGKPAGTAWSPLWCFDCNCARMRRIDASMRAIADRLKPQPKD